MRGSAGGVGGLMARSRALIEEVTERDRWVSDGPSGESFREDWVTVARCTRPDNFIEI